MRVQDIPLLQWSQRNEARRLVTLIDTVYDMRCRLECSAAGRPRQVHLQSLCVFLAANSFIAGI